MKSCCIAGHPNIPPDKMGYVKERLREEIEAALEDGFHHFISNFEDGAGLLGAEIIVDMIEAGHKLELEAALYTKSRVDTLMATPTTAKLLTCSQYIGVHAADGLDDTLKCNRFIANNAQRIIAVYAPQENARKDCLVQLMRFTHILEVKERIITI